MMMIKKLRVGYAYACPPRWMIIMTNIMVVILDVSNDDDDDDVDDDDDDDNDNNNADDVGMKVFVFAYKFAK